MDQAAKKIEFKKVRKFGEIIDDTFQFIKQNFKLLCKSFFIITGPVLLPLSILSGLQNADTFREMAQTVQETDITAPAEILGYKYFLIMILSLVFFTLLQLIVYELVILYIKDKENAVDTPRIWNSVKQDFFMIFFTNIGLFIVLGFSMVLLVFPFFYFAIVLSITPIVRIQERIGFFKSIGRSMRLMSGNWWITLGILIILFIIFMIFAGVMGLPYYGLILFVMLSESTIQQLEYYNLLFIVTTAMYLISYILYTIPIIGIAFQYYNLVEKKDGAGLLEKVETI